MASTLVRASDSRADDDRVRSGVGVERVQGTCRGDSEAPALARSEAPVTVMPPELRSLLVEDRPVDAREALPVEELAIVVAGQEARLLALRPGGDGKACPVRLRTRLLLRL